MEKLSNKINKIDNYINVLVSIWIKSKKVINETNKNNFKANIKNLISSIETIRQETDKKGFKKLSLKLSQFENELKNKDDFVNKLSQLSSLVVLFDLPPEIENILKDIGLLDDNNAFNDLFDDIDLDEIQNLKDEGTLIDTLKEKKKPKEINEPLEKKITLDKIKEDTGVSNKPPKILQIEKNQKLPKIKEKHKHREKIKESPKLIDFVKEKQILKNNNSEKLPKLSSLNSESNKKYSFNSESNKKYSYLNFYGQKYDYYPNPHDF